MSEISARERIILAVDTSIESEAERLAYIAQTAGASCIKLGLELQSATSWAFCSELAGKHGLDWVADAKIHDIPNTTAKTVANIAALEHPPVAITMHTTSGIESMRVAQKEAGDIRMLGVTILTSISDTEVSRIFRVRPKPKVRELAELAVEAGIAGVVCSGEEVGIIKSSDETRKLWTMIPGTRSVGADTQDQARIVTPTQAIRQGADWLVIGRQITQADDPLLAFENLATEIQEAR